MTISHKSTGLTKLAVSEERTYPEGGLFQLGGHLPLVRPRFGVRGGGLVTQKLPHGGSHVIGDGADPLQVCRGQIGSARVGVLGT